MKNSRESPLVINPFEKWKVRSHFNIILLLEAFKLVKSPLSVWSLIRSMKNKYNFIFGEKPLRKIAKVNGRYYWRLASPGFPSQAATIYYRNEMKRFIENESNYGLGILFLGITKSCPLSCEHCYEWDRMHEKDRMTKVQLLKIVHEYQEFGTTQIQFTGGEPLTRLSEIHYLLKNAKKTTDFWIVSSGWKLNLQQAISLKKAGLTGIMVSIDFHIAALHNQFRGKNGVFEAAVKTLAVAKESGLITGLSFCPTKNYISRENLMSYMEMAKRMGVSIINILEPKPIGRYSGKNILLSPARLKLLDEMYLTFNGNKKYSNYPIINYAGYHQRKTGCFGNGDYFFYIDTNGDAHTCPVCSQKICSALEFPPSDTISLLKQTSNCHYFNKYIERTSLEV
jgi:MoaA/NifB/PqqE/SkfB family radical SAM enzyme